MSICIYMKQKDTVCHIWFMCNTFSGCLKVVVSSILLCLGIAYVWSYWNCLPWIVAWSWWKDNVTSTFLTDCHISHLHWVYRTHPQSRTETHTQLTPHCPSTLPVNSSLRRFLPPGPSSHSHTPVPLQRNMHRTTYLLLVLTFLLLNSLFPVFHSLSCAFFSAFSANLDVNFTLRKNERH